VGAGLVAGCGGSGDGGSAAPVLAALPDQSGATLHLGPPPPVGPDPAPATTKDASDTGDSGGSGGSGGSSGDKPPSGPVRATMIGDSVASGISESPEAQQELNRGIHTFLDLKACRRLAGESCTFDGLQPPTALDVIESRGDRLGSVLVIDVGYNDETADYKANIEKVISEAKAHGVDRFVWVLLREHDPAPETYAATNQVIRAAAARHPEIQVADWNAFSQNKPATWFGGDGLHLSPDGATELARLVRPYIAGQG
jgi:hypothetical protein